MRLNENILRFLTILSPGAVAAKPIKAVTIEDEERKEDVWYVGVVAWQKLAESCASKLKKGSAVYIEGELRSRTLDHDDGTRHSLVEIRAHHIQFLDKAERLDE